MSDQQSDQQNDQPTPEPKPENKSRGCHACGTSTGGCNDPNRHGLIY